MCLSHKTGQRISGAARHSCLCPAVPADGFLRLLEWSCIALGSLLATSVDSARLLCTGPLFFGFSDIITQRAIASMYTEREMEAALQVHPAQPSSLAHVAVSHAGHSQHAGA